MEETPSAPTSCAQKSIGTWSFHLRTRHWRITPCGCQCRTSWIVVESAGSFTGETWLEERFRVTATFGANSDEFSVWELIDKILQFIPNRSNHLDLIVDGASAVSSFDVCSIILFVMLSKIPWNMVVPLESTTLSYRSLRI